jgi:hypothetical protein
VEVEQVMRQWCWWLPLVYIFSNSKNLPTFWSPLVVYVNSSIVVSAFGCFCFSRVRTCCRSGCHLDRRLRAPAQWAMSLRGRGRSKSSDCSECWWELSLLSREKSLRSHFAFLKAVVSLAAVVAVVVAVVGWLPEFARFTVSPRESGWSSNQ